MKRRDGWMVASMALSLAACSPEGDAPEVNGSPPAGGGWLSPPRIGAVLATGGDLVIRGQASPGGRVALRSATGEAFAATADAQGQFELRMPRPAVDRLLSPEIQAGEDAAAAPERLLVLSGGPIALLRPGGASQRLDRSAPLESVDSDGRSLLATGHAAPGARVSVDLGAGPRTVTADARGRWVSSAGGGGPVAITVSGIEYAYPGWSAAAGDGLVAHRAGAGWIASWSLPPAARQSSWFPQSAEQGSPFNPR